MRRLITILFNHFITIYISLRFSLISLPLKVDHKLKLKPDNPFYGIKPTFFSNHRNKGSTSTQYLQLLILS